MGRRRIFVGDSDGESVVPPSNASDISDVAPIDDIESFHSDRYPTQPHPTLTTTEEGDDIGQQSEGRTRLRKLIEKQRKNLPRVSSKRVDIFRAKRNRRRMASDVSEPSESKSREEQWKDMVGHALLLDPTFFTSPMALLQDETKKKRGTHVYQGVKATEANCHDLELVFDLKYRAKSLFLKKKNEAFQTLRSVVGQLLRFAIASGVIKKEVGHAKNDVFRIMADYELLEAFMNHFVLTASPYTVASKCNNLLVVHGVGRVQLHEDVHLLAKYEFTEEFLKNTAASSKSAGRTLSHRRRLIENALEADNLLHDEDMRKAFSLAKHKLQDILFTYRTDESRERGSFRKRLENCEDLLHKWCLNLLAAIVLSCGGQRPQAIASIQVPLAKELSSVQETSFGSFFSLRSAWDKRERSLNFPVILLPVSIKEFVRFHVKVIRVYFGERYHLQDEDDDHRLLFHSRDGYWLSTRNVTLSLRAFMVNMDKRFKFVSSMVLRASYATSMIHSYRTGRIGEGLVENKFLELLANRMNTSIQQLKDAYIHISRADYQEGVRVAMEHFLVVMEEDGDESNE